MKSRSIGSLILLAILAPSCGGKGGGGSTFVGALWQNQFRSPTSSHLRAVRFADNNTGIVAGDATSIFRTDDGGFTWFQEEVTPANNVGDIVAMSVAKKSAVAVGSDNIGGQAWGSENGKTWFGPGTAGNGAPFTDVVIKSPASGSAPTISLRLHSDGIVEEAGGSSPGFSSSGTWVSANGLAFWGSTQDGWVCGEQPANTGKITRTVNNGADNWTASVTIPAVGILRRLQFLDDPVAPGTVGYCCGDNGVVLQTGNAGLTWTAIAAGPMAGVTLRGISFLDKDHGWVVGDGGKLFHLVNNSGWSVTAISTGVTRNLYAISMVDDLNGYAVGDFGTVIKIFSGAAYEFSSPTQAALATLPQLNAVDFSATGVVGLAVGENSTVLRTLNGGATWENFNNGVPGGLSLKGVCIPRNGGGDMAYLCGASNTVLIQPALKGAATGAWIAATTVPAGTYEGLMFPNGDVIGAAVGGGKVVFSVDNGIHWTDATFPAGTYHAVTATPGGTTLYAVGDAGKIIQSTDGGATWADFLPGIGATPSLKCVAAPGGPTFTLFVAGDDSIVRRFNGVSWSTATPAAGQTIVGLGFADDLDGVAVLQGTGGGLFKTLDGVTWTRSFAHTKYTLRGITLKSNGVGYVVGDNGTILQTVTAGQ